MTFIIAGIACEVINANGWFLIPQYCTWICFGIATLSFITKLIVYNANKKQIKKMAKRF